jgi:dUTP pyrophosphatase
VTALSESGGVKERLQIPVSREPGFEDLPLPEYQTPGSSGLDLYAALHEPVTLAPGEFKLISAGIRIALPEGFEGQVRARSGLAVRNGIGVLNGPGTIDSDYRGVVSVILFHFGREPLVIRRGDRIAQLVIHKYEKVNWIEAPRLDETSRNSNGFGSTGIE